MSSIHYTSCNVSGCTEILVLPNKWGWSNFTSIVLKFSLALFHHNLDMFTKLWKVTIKLHHVCPTVCTFTHMEQIGSHWMDFHEVTWSNIFQKSVGKIQVSLKSDKNNGQFTWRLMHTYESISQNSSYNEKCFRPNL
jgi:hypothetical protein